MPSKSVLRTALISLRQSGRSRRTRLVTFAVLLAGLAFTTAAVLSAREAISHESRARFQSEVDRLQATIQRQVMVAEYPLRGLAASYTVMGGMTRRQFRMYVQQRELERYFPGMHGMGLVEPVPAHQRDAFIAGVRKEGLADFTPESGASDKDALIVRYAEPMEAVGGTLGMDLNLHRERLETVRRAIATQSTALSGPVRLKVDGREQLGWNMMTPVLSKAGQLRAVMGARLIAAEVLRPIKNDMQRRVDFRLYDASPSPGVLLFDSLASDTLADRATQAIAPQFTTRRSLLIGGRLMTLDVGSTPLLESSQGRRLPWVIGISGAGLSALLALAALLLLSARDRALSMAEVMTSDLRRMARVVERTSSAVFGLDVDGRITWVNPSFEKLMGLSTDECMGQLAISLPQIAGSDRDSRAALAVAIERREGRRLETASERSGARFWTDTEVQPTRDARGEVTGFICITSDITRRKEAELRLKDSEHLMRVIADNLPARVSYWDRQGRCRFVNRAFCEFFDRPAHELQDQPLTAGIFGNASAHLPYARRALAGEAQHFEHLETDARGRVAAWQMHYIPDEEDGEVRGFTVLALDVTELRRARDMAVEASQAKSRFLSNMSHEIRTPLNAVMGMLGLLRNTRLDERQLDYADKAHRAARSLLSLINDILDLSKIEAGKMVLAPRAFALDDLLRDLSVVMAGSVGSKDLEVLFDVDAQVPPQLVADDLRLRQILINLGSNAVKFTAQGEVVLQIRLLGRQDDVARLEVSMSDTGVGIAPEHQARVFQDFSQAGAETAREFGGTGLGLGICQRLLWLMGSDLHLESTPGKGSRFWFELSLPVARDAAVAATAPSPVRKVLIVDDNAHAREVLRAMAASLGWKADVAEGGDRALEMVRATDPKAPRYNAVFIDWQMPGRDGWQTCAGLRELPAAAGAPMVALVSAQERETLGQRPASEQKLLDGFLLKPVTASMLAGSIAPSRGVSASERTAGIGERPLAGLRLLLVEDNLVNQQVASELLAAQGAQIEIAVDGQQAVDRIRAHGDRLDAVLMDVQMPVMDGRAAARAVREQLNNWQLPIIAMTANAMESDRVECLAAGMNDHIGKPFEVDEVVRTILRHARPQQTRPPAVPAPVAAPAVPAPAPSVVAGTEPQSPVLDRERAIARLGGNHALYERLLPSFTENLRGTAARLPTLLNTVPQDEAVRLMHTLKGTAATMGAQQLADAAAQAEALLAGPLPVEPNGDVLRGVAAAIDFTLAALQHGEA